MSEQELKAYEALMEKIRAEEPVSSCDMVRAWVKLNIESSMAPIGNN